MLVSVQHRRGHQRSINAKVERTRSGDASEVHGGIGPSLSPSRIPHIVLAAFDSATSACKLTCGTVQLDFPRLVRSNSWESVETGTEHKASALKVVYNVTPVLGSCEARTRAVGRFQLQ